MLKKILIPLDGSALAERALALATALSVPTAAHLVLLRAAAAHTLPGTDPIDAQVTALGEANGYLRGVAARLMDRGFVVDYTTPYGGSAADWIIDETATQHADLVVMSTHGRTGPGRWLFGSVAEAVVSRSRVPVLLQRGWDPQQRRLLLEDRPRLLVPLDGSRFAEAALPSAAGLAGDLGADLMLLSVDTTPRDVKTAEEDVAAYFDAQGSRAGAETQTYLHDIATNLSAQWPDVEVNLLAEAGEPSETIPAVADASHVALVIMATHGRTGLIRSTLGSVAGRVLEHGTTPLVLVGPTLLSAAGPDSAQPSQMHPERDPRSQASLHLG